MRFKHVKGFDKAMEYKSQWVAKKNCLVKVTKAESILAANGINIVDVKSVLRPALVEEPYFPIAKEEDIRQEKPPCYMLTNYFRPLAKFQQCQLITNSLILPFPDSFLENVKVSTDEEKEMINEMVVRANLLDAVQKRLPKNLDVHKHPGYRSPREWGIRMDKKINNIAYHMLTALDRTHTKKELRSIIHKATSRVTLKHHDNLMNLNHKSEMLLCAKDPLGPFMNPDEVKALEGASLPDIFPLSPFIHARSEVFYNDTDGYAISGSGWAPHTVIIGCPDVPFLIQPEQFYGMSLVFAFSFAASYAREVNKNASGDLKKPVTINIVHTNAHMFHVGRFQLNTLDCSSPVRNMFWHEPWTAVYEKIGHEAAKPSLTNLNTRPYDLLKAMY